MALADDHGHAIPSWFVAPGDGDAFAWLALALVLLALYGVVTLYAAFDRWAERKAHGTPLAKTIPTLLMIALLYEIFPLAHFHILLPISAILIALMADWARFYMPQAEEVAAESATPQAVDAPERTMPPPADPESGPEEDKHA